jgi:hypothetical protein
MPRAEDLRNTIRTSLGAQGKLVSPLIGLLCSSLQFLRYNVRLPSYGSVTSRVLPFCHRGTEHSDEAENSYMSPVLKW